MAQKERYIHSCCKATQVPHKAVRFELNPDLTMVRDQDYDRVTHVKGFAHAMHGELLVSSYHSYNEKEGSRAGKNGSQNIELTILMAETTR